MPTIAEQLTQLTQDRDDLVDNLTTKGITGLTGDETFTELVPEVLNIPSGGGSVEPEEKDVNFYDYDGTRLYSYTASEFANLTEMPANPEHDGLTAQGWNWDLNDAKTYINNYGELDIGQCYLPTDGKTKIYIELDDERKTPTLCFFASGTPSIVIDWGDGSATETVTTKNEVKKTHTYPSGGQYIISLNVVSGKLKIVGNSSYGCTFLYNNYTSINSSNSVYQTAIKKIVLGTNCFLGGYAFSRCYNLENIILNNYDYSSVDYTDIMSMFERCESLKNITLPKNHKKLGINTFAYCYSLKRVILSQEVTEMYAGCFDYCHSLNKVFYISNLTSQSLNYINRQNYTLKKAFLPLKVTSFSGGNEFQNATSLTTVIFGEDITSIGSPFSGCYSLKKIDFHLTKQIPTISSSTFSAMPSDCQIIVPDALYETWIAASNWSTYASQIVKASEA